MAVLPRPPEEPEKKKKPKEKKIKTEKERQEFHRDLAIIGLCSVGILIFLSAILNQLNNPDGLNSTGTRSIVRQQGLVKESIQPTTPLPTPTPVVTREESLEEEMVELVNYQRALHGYEPLKIDTVLTKIAVFRSEDMARNNYFSHEPPDGCDSFCWMDLVGYQRSDSAENIAMNNYPRSETLESTMDDFMESPSHKEAILNCVYEKIGIGVIKIDNKYYYTQVFDGSNSCKNRLSP